MSWKFGDEGLILIFIAIAVMGHANPKIWNAEPGQRKSGVTNGQGVGSWSREDQLWVNQGRAGKRDPPGMGIRRQRKKSTRV